MKPSNHLILSTSPLAQTARKPRRTASPTHPQRLLYGRKRHHPTGKERDSETGLHYYGARYLDGRTGRWISGDPAVEEYVPEAPVDGEARKRNGNLPGMGGVFNYANLHVYHYAGNNPVKYIDPDGEKPKQHTELTKGRAKAEMLDIFGASIKTGLGVKFTGNLIALIKINIGIDLGSLESVQDKNGLNSFDTAGFFLTLDVLGFGEIGAEFSKTAPASNTNSFFDNVKNAWQNGKTKVGGVASFFIKGANITADDDNDLKIDIGGQLGVGFKVWINLTEVKDLIRYGGGLLKATLTQD